MGGLTYVTTKLIAVAVLVALIASIALCASPSPTQPGRFQISSDGGTAYMVDTATGKLYTANGFQGWQWHLKNTGTKGATE